MQNGFQRLTTLFRRSDSLPVEAELTPVWQRMRLENKLAYDFGAVSLDSIAPAGRSGRVAFTALRNLSQHPPAFARATGLKLLYIFTTEHGWVFSAGGLRFQFQRTPYTPFALLGVTRELRSNPEPDDLRGILRLAAVLPRRIFWHSGPRSGGSVPHCHFQGHLRDWIGGTLPIEDTRRRRLAENGEAHVDAVMDFPLPAISVTARGDREALVETAWACISELHWPFNLVVPSAREIIIIGRRRVKPEGWDKSFGGSEASGLLVLTKELPGDLPSYERLWAALEGIGLPCAAQDDWEDRIRARFYHGAPPDTQRETVAAGSW